MPSEADVDRLRHLSTITANYRGLRGLVALPIIAWAAIDVVGGFTGWRTAELRLLALPLAIAAAYLIGRAYIRRFGQVRAKNPAVTWTAAITALIAFLGAGLLAGRTGALESPVWVGGLQAALFFAVLAFLPPLLTGRFHDLRVMWHWPAMVAGLVLSSLVPLGIATGGPHPLNLPVETAGFGLLSAFALCLLIGGLLDHRLLAKALGHGSDGPR